MNSTMPLVLDLIVDGEDIILKKQIFHAKIAPIKIALNPVIQKALFDHPVALNNHFLLSKKKGMKEKTVIDVCFFSITDGY